MRALWNLLVIVSLLAVVALAQPTASQTLPQTTAATGGQIAINEVVFRPLSGQHEWVELTNSGDAPIAIGGYRLVDGDDHLYMIPNALPPVPPAAFVTIRFDGAGAAADDLSFAGDNAATLHSRPGMTHILDDAADQVALYDFRANLTLHTLLPLVGSEFSPYNPPVPLPPAPLPTDSLVSYVAWGVPPGEQAALAEQAAVWARSWFVSLYRGLGEESPEMVAPAGDGIGVVPGGAASTLDAWMLYNADELTPGSANQVPAISWWYPPDGGIIAGSTFMIGWNSVTNATGYQFQLDDNADFSSPLVNTMLTDPGYQSPSHVADGTYHWRTRVHSGALTSAWSDGDAVTAITLPAPRGPETRALKTLDIAWQLQHKDSGMLCLDGDAETGGNAWNAPHTSRGTHGRNYCARASIAMIASYYGGKLSQDRISYEIFKGGAPQGDMGHDVPVTGAQAQAGLSWALGTPVPAVMGKPTFAQIKAWIDNNQPLRAIIPGHSRALDGYWEFTVLGVTFEMLHILDPWDAPKWVAYSSDAIIYVQPGPSGAAGAPGVRSDEDIDRDGIADTVDDSDGDGVVDFDERNRFATQVNDADSDDDEVPDGADIREYVFEPVTNAYKLFKADVDNDGVRKELDRDNDTRTNNGTLDGCEDSNRNGAYEAVAGESDNFNPVDDKLLHIRLQWNKLGTDVDLHLVKPGGSYNGGGDVHWRNPAPDWGPVGPCGNPTLDVDCITICTVENIRLDTLEAGQYRVIVHYYSDHDRGSTTATVTLRAGNTTRTYRRTIFDGSSWTVATITWPGLTISSIDTVGPDMPFPWYSVPAKSE